MTRHFSNCHLLLHCRLFLSAEPPPALERGLPINLLQNSIKLTNEPPEGLRPNLIRAFNTFNEEMLESCAKQVRAGPALAAAIDCALLRWCFLLWLEAPPHACMSALIK